VSIPNDPTTISQKENHQKGKKCFTKLYPSKPEEATTTIKHKPSSQ